MCLSCTWSADELDAGGRKRWRVSNYVVAKLIVPVEELAAIATGMLQRRRPLVTKVGRVTLNS